MQVRVVVAPQYIDKDIEYIFCPFCGEEDSLLEPKGQDFECLTCGRIFEVKK